MRGLGRVLVVAVALGLGVLAGPGAALAQFPFGGTFAFYDDFASLLFEPSRWVPTEQFAGGSASPNLDTFRGIVATKTGPQAQLTLHSWGRQDQGNAGQSGRSSQRLDLRSPGDITAIIAQVTVLTAKAVGCSLNPARTESAVFILGRFFNDGGSTGPNDQTGNISAGIYLMQDSASKPRIGAFLVRCEDATCDTFSTVVPDVVFTLTWAPGRASNYGIQWDAANDQFIVAVMDASYNAIETQFLSYAGHSDSDPLVGPDRKTIMASHRTANCAPPGKRTEGNLTALIDNVIVNQ